MNLHLNTHQENCQRFLEYLMV